MAATGAMLAGEGLLSLLVWFAMDGLGHLRLNPGKLVTCAAAWFLARALVLALRVPPSRRWLVEIPLAGLILGGVNVAFRCGLTWGQVLYALVPLALLSAAWERLLAAAAARGDAAAEAARLVLVGGAGVWVAAPMFTDLLIGGVDARWYAYMLTDFITQLRSGFFPMIVGQGEFAYNGGVHPFRTAPFFHHWAGLWDLLTARALSPLALEHLTVIAAALGGALGMYAVLTRLAPARRWTAMAVAMIYVTSPAFLGVIYRTEAYMTYMTILILPWVALANVRLTQNPTGRQWIWLAVALVVVWTSHAGVALFCMMATALIQGGRFLLEEQPGRAWWQVAGSAALFLALGAYYFVSLMELPRAPQAGVLATGTQVAGAALATVGIVRALLWRRGRAVWMLAAGGALLGWVQPAWLAAMAVAAVLIGVVAFAARRAGWFEPRDHAWALLAGGLLAAGVLLPLTSWVPTNGQQQAIVDRLMAYKRSVPALLAVGTEGGAYYQPGFGALLLAAGLAVSALAGGSFRSRLFLVPLALFLISCRPVPLLSEFWVAHFPGLFMEITDFPLEYRLLPPFVAFSCVAGMVWLPDLARQRPRLGKSVDALLLVLAAWGCVHAWPYLHLGWITTAPRAQTEIQFRPENAHLDRYAYDRMYVPRYYSDGKTDVRLESRLLDSGKRLVVGPDQTALRMEALGKEERSLHAVVEPTAPIWLNLTLITLAPNEQLLLRFSFLPKRYEGWLIFKSTHIYREYRLPDSGWIKAFGAGPGRSRVISLWNSGSVPEEVSVTFMRTGTFSPTEEFGDFGTLTISHFHPELASVRLESLLPYRASVESPGEGWLETPRLFLPGYAASVDGRPAEVRASPDYLVMVPVPAGSHVVELRFEGSVRLWLAWWVSAAAWIALGIFGLREIAAHEPAAP